MRQKSRRKKLEKLPCQERTTKAYDNHEFLKSAGGRSIRVQCELTEPSIRLKNQRVRNTIVLFGSARFVDAKRANAQLAEAEAAIARGRGKGNELRRNLRAARYRVRTAGFYEAARELARLITEWSMTIDKPGDRFLICSGGGPGIMEAANRGAAEAGGRSVGLGISLPFEQSMNPYISPELRFEFHYFFIRKYWFLYLAKALVVFPGGFGTMDELFEMLTLIQTHKTQKHVPVILFGSDFWREVINFEALKRWGVISPHDLDRFVIMDSVAKIRDYIVRDVSEHYLRRRRKI